MNSGDAFSNYVNAKLKVDETFIIDKRTARKRKKSYAEGVTYDNTLTCANTTDSPKIYCELKTLIKTLILKKKCCKILQKLAISYLETLRIKEES